MEGHSTTGAESQEAKCLLGAVLDVMQTEPALEAVKLDRGRETISVATLGRLRNPSMEQTLAAQIKVLREEPNDNRCVLLEGRNDCDVCPLVASVLGRDQVTIKSDDSTTTISRLTCPTAAKFWRWHDFPFPKFSPRSIEVEGPDEWQWQLAAAGLCGLLGVCGHFIAPGNAALVLRAGAFVAGGWFAAKEVWVRLQHRTLDVHFLMLAVAAGSAAIGAWDEGTILLFLFSLSGALEHYAMGRTQKEIRSLFREAPKEATILVNGEEKTILVEQLQPGMRVLIKPGAQFPVDGEVARGSTAADESNLTGEAVPVEKKVGDTVLGGTLNSWGAVEITVLRPISQSALQKIIELIREAQHSKAPAQLFTDKFGTTYTYGILALTFVMFFVWWLAGKHEPWISTPEDRSAFYRAMTLLVVASPCALVLSIPSAVLAAIAWGAKRGILFRGGAAVEKLADVSVVAMDKTGTLTTGELAIDRIESFPPGREDEVALLAFSLESLSAHPLARAIVRHGKRAGLKAFPLEKFESITGKGLKAMRGGDEVFLGRRDWIEPHDGAEALKKVPASESGVTEVWVAHGNLVGRILLRDDLRPEARNTVEKLKEMGRHLIVLTGDRQATADHLKQLLGLSDVRAELSPKAKVEIVRSFNEHGQRVAMIGDGVNDAASLAAAHVGVAMGARGSDAALEQADVVLMHDRLENFLLAFELSCRARRIIRENLVISIGAASILILFALAGKIPLSLGVLGHEGSTVIVVLNSLRLLLR